MLFFKTTGRNFKEDFELVRLRLPDTNNKEKESDILPSFIVGEKGPTNLHFLRKETILNQF
jgi:DNA topoisomerase-3